MSENLFLTSSVSDCDLLARFWREESDEHQNWHVFFPRRRKGWLVVANWKFSSFASYFQDIYFSKNNHPLLVQILASGTFHSFKAGLLQRFSRCVLRYIVKLEFLIFRFSKLDLVVFISKLTRWNFHWVEGVASSEKTWIYYWGNLIGGPASLWKRFSWRKPIGLWLSATISRTRQVVNLLSVSDCRPILFSTNCLSLFNLKSQFKKISLVFFLILPLILLVFFWYFFYCQIGSIITLAEM